MLFHSKMYQENYDGEKIMIKRISLIWFSHSAVITCFKLVGVKNLEYSVHFLVNQKMLFSRLSSRLILKAIINGMWWSLSSEFGCSTSFDTTTLFKYLVKIGRMFLGMKRINVCRICQMAQLYNCQLFLCVFFGFSLPDHKYLVI